MSYFVVAKCHSFNNHLIFVRQNCLVFLFLSLLFHCYFFDWARPICLPILAQLYAITWPKRINTGPRPACSPRSARHQREASATVSPFTSHDHIMPSRPIALPSKPRPLFPWCRPRCLSRKTQPPKSKRTRPGGPLVGKPVRSACSELAHVKLTEASCKFPHVL